MSRAFLAADAGQPMTVEVVAALRRAESLGWADPQLRAHEGRQSLALLEAASTAIQTAVTAPGARVMFFPGADLALAEAVAGVGVGPDVVTTAVDRQVVLRAAAARALGPEGDGFEPLAVDRSGRVAPETVAAALRPTTGVVAVQVGNPEVGTLQPVPRVHALCREAGVPLLLDATMAGGRSPLPDTWDALALDGRCWGGGGGVAAVVLRPGVRWHPRTVAPVSQLPMGAPAVAACAAAALGLESAARSLPQRAPRDMALIDRLRAGLAGVPDVQIHGDPVDRLPHVLGFSVLYLDAEALLLELDRAGISVSSGSACAVESGQPSHVLAAIGALTSGNIRVTLPLDAREADVDRLLALLPGMVARMRTDVGL